MRRTKDEAAVTRATLLKTALSIFSAKGYSAATLDDVAKAARLTRGAIYWHFKSKADLYNTLVQEVSARGAAVVQGAVAEGGTLIEILRRVFVRQCALIEEDKEARAVMELALFKTGLDSELQAAHFSIEALEAIYRRLLKIDEGVKTSRVTLDLALDTLVAEVAR